jgi:CelD/BcsL family acetyltransferase involved in cellulose biosynthesis
MQEIIEVMAAAGRLRITLMELEGSPIAATLCFDYKKEVLLYNSGFDPEYRWVSAGLISKALVIENSIERGMSCFNFLKGDEQYKYHLGGRSMPLYRCTIELS